MKKKIIATIILIIFGLSVSMFALDSREQFRKVVKTAIRDNRVVKIDSCLYDEIIENIINENKLLDNDTISIAISSQKIGGKENIAVTLMFRDEFVEIRCIQESDSCGNIKWETSKRKRWDLMDLHAELNYPTDLWLFYLKQWHTVIPNFILKGTVLAYPDLNFVGFRILKKDLESYTCEQFPMTFGGYQDQIDWYIEIVKIIKQHYDSRSEKINRERNNKTIVQNHIYDIDFSTLTFSTEEMKKLFFCDHLTIIIDSTIYGQLIEIGNENWVKRFYAERKIKQIKEKDLLIEVRFLNRHVNTNFFKKEDYEHSIKFEDSGLLMDTIFDYFLYYQEESIPDFLMKNIEAKQLPNDSLGNETVYQIKRCSDGRLKTTTLTFSIFQGE